MAENLAPISVANDIPTKKYVDDLIVTVDEVAITAGVTPSPARDLWVDTSALGFDVSREEFEALAARVAALEGRV